MKQSRNFVWVENPSMIRSPRALAQVGAFGPFIFTAIYYTLATSGIWGPSTLLPFTTLGSLGAFGGPQLYFYLLRWATSPGAAMGPDWDVGAPKTVSWDAKEVPK